ncbi:hypothetical protein [Falsirhodobacter algicola]|uniref:Uncharacterized protein n=1 Tax=Falsirhodobacter algicola TaxID=2692330 RepID=A0A8J8MS37_9RHOB|nr:hypothetical protein [Falsirhodobacter algicola]QUS35705.1 hypothetical protein GR316_05130 [Falsirhodobacter algicola]
MKSKTESGEMFGDKDITPGVFVSIDPAAKLEGRYEIGGGKVIGVEYRNAGGATPKWIAMHVSLGEVELTDNVLVGVVLRSSAPAAATFRICLRTYVDGQFQDEFFLKNVVSYQEDSTHLDVLRLDKVSPIFTRDRLKRELILFLPPNDTSVEISDIRVFIV